TETQLFLQASLELLVVDELASVGDAHQLPQVGRPPRAQLPVRLEMADLRAGQDRSQVHRLAERQLRGHRVEVVLRGGSDAIDPGAELDDVQVKLEDLLLGELLLEQQGEHRLLQLARQRLLALEIDVLRELHADGAAAPHEAARLNVLTYRVCDGLAVETVVVKK